MQYQERFQCLAEVAFVLYAIVAHAFTHYAPFIFISNPFTERLPPDVPSALKNDLSFSGLNRPPGVMNCRFPA